MRQHTVKRRTLLRAVSAVALLATASACSSTTASSATRSTAGSPSEARSVLTSPAAAPSPAASASPARWPQVVTADSDHGFPGQDALGSPAPAAAVVARAADGAEQYGLADCGPFLGSAYPVVSHDDGTTWQITGPQLYRAAADGAGAVTYIAAARRRIVAWGPSLVTSPDGGHTWWRTYLGEGIRTVEITGAAITALAAGPALPGDPTRFVAARYRSADGGRSWQWVGTAAPVPAEAIGPDGTTRRFCG